MLNTNEAYALANWIKNKRKISGENPKLYECIYWYKWRFEDRELSVSDKNSMAHILNYN